MPRRDHINPNKRRSFKKGDYDPAANQAIPSHWAAWMTTFRNTFVRILAPSKAGPDVVLYIPGRYGKTSIALELTALTEEELDTFQKFWNETIDLARPVCQLRDRVAGEKNAAGDDSDGRIYRAVPTVTIRPWAVGINPESLFDRLAYVPEGDGSDGDSSEGAGASGGGMAQPQSQRSEGSQDDESQVDQSASIREVGRPVHPGELQAPGT